MMPGETQAKPVGIASEAAGACQNCTALQQSLNEYVAALLGLKQRIIDSEENDTLRCQLEQLLQKVSPQAQNQEDLKSLRAELEEKTSSLKIYQQTEIEYTRVKEECAKSNIVKKKLESKLKRMEEVSVKRFQDFKKLKMEKKELVKDFKKIQNKLKCFQNGKRTKATKNVHTQIANDEPVVSVDKRKIKLLLDELWGCIDSSPNKSQFHFQLLDKSGRRTRTQRDSDENKMTPNHSSPFTLNDMSAEPAELPVITGSNELKMSKGSKILEESVADCNGDSAFYEEKTADYLVSDLPGSYSLSSDHGTMASEFLEMINWARPLPPLLSPIAFSPSTSQDELFGEFTDSSYEEERGSAEGSSLNSKMESLNSSANQSCPKDQTDLIDVCEIVNESSCFLNRRKEVHNLDFPKDISKKTDSDALLSSSSTTELQDNGEKSADNFASVCPTTDIVKFKDLTVETIQAIESEKTIDSKDCSEAFLSKPSTAISATTNSEILTLCESTAADLKESNLDQSESCIDKALTQRTEEVVCSLSLHENLQILPFEKKTKKHTKIFCQEDVQNVIHKSKDVSSPQLDFLQCVTGEKMNERVYITETSMTNCSHYTSSSLFKETFATMPHNSLSNFQNTLKQDNSFIKLHNLITEVNNSGKNQKTLTTAEMQSDRLPKCDNDVVLNEIDSVNKQQTDKSIENDENCISSFLGQKTLKSLKEEQEFVIKDKVDLGPSSINSEENMEPSCSGKFLNECVHSDNGQVQQSCEVTQTKAISESDANKKCRATSIKELEVSVVTSSQEQQEQPVSYNQPEKSCKAKNSVLDTPESMKTLERERSDDEQLALKSPNNKVSLFYHNASSTSISTIQTLSDEDGEHYQGETEETPDRRNTDKIEKTVDGSTNLLSMSLAAFEKSTKACKINSNKSHLINNSEQTFENTLKKQTNIKVSEEKNGSQDLVRIDSGSNPDNHIPKFKLSSSKHGQEHGHLLLNRKPAFFTESNIPPPKTEILKCIESLPEHSKIPSEQTKENITSSDRFLHSTDLHVKPANEVVTESYHQLLSKTSKLSLKDTDVMGTSLREINIKSLQAANLQEIQNSENKISEQSSVLSIFKMKEMYRSGYIDSDDSEDDFPVRKVNYAKFSPDNSAASANASLNLQNANKDTSELAADDSLDKCVDVEVKYNIKDNIIKPGTDINLISQNKITVDKVKENSIKLYHFESLKNPDHSISEGCRSLPDSLLLETKNFDSAKIQNDPFNNTNAVTFPTVEKELTLNDDQTDIGKGTSPFKEQEGQDISAISDVLSQMHNTEDQSAQNDDQAPGRSIVPGKNLIWNFERLDDFPDPRGKKYKKSSQKKPAKNIFANCNANAGSASKFLEGSNNPGNNLSGPETRKEKYSVSQRALSLNSQLGQTVLANADTSTKTQHSPETINKVRSEMGPPLPPLLGPLLATPPRTVRPLSPVMSSSSRSSLPSPLDDLISPLRVTPVPPVMSPVSDCRQYKSPIFTTPSPSEKGSRRILSSPLQFCAATLKHALPVPGRLPPSAAVNSAPTVQENSVKILDTMYPELSARARTLNILKGNVQLNRCIPGDSKPTVSQISGFKAITSTSTAFIKTGNNSKTSSNQDKQRDGGTNQSSSISASVNKRSSDCITMPKSAKRLRLDSESPVAANLKACFTAPSDKSPVTKEEAGYCDTDIEVASVHATAEDDVAKALKKVEELCFDLLPVIRSHIYVGTIPQIPVMRNEEKEVIYEFSSIKKGKVEDLLHAILKKLKTEKASLDGSVIQALCRVYTGLCRQIGDLERARVLSYCIFTEDFPEPDKMLLFIISSWNKVLSQNSVINRALQALLKQLAKDDVRICLSAYLNWEKSPPQNMRVILSSVMNGIQLCSELKFHQSEQFGEDLTDKMWEYIFAVNLMCCHRKWIWTHDNVISKELWPILDKWVKRKKGHVKNSFVTDIIVATVLRLVGCLCQMGLKEGFTAAVKNICAVIIAFIQHAQQEDMPWGVQLASVYMLCDVSPCDPQTIHKTLEDWRKAATNSIPPALTSALAEVASLTAIEN
eukprot:XP_017950409.1 PREDICTED: little elongation complex subunit 1 isoform X2 [Xenopus tropicalis]